MRQSSSDKEHNLSLRLVLFFPFPLLFSWLSTYLFIDREMQETIPLQFPGCFSVFFTRNTLRKNLFLLNDCEALAKRERCKLQAPIYKACILAWMSHLTCEWTYHFSHTWRNIVRSSDWPELICVWKIYIIKLNSHLCEQLYVCFVFPIQTTWCSLGNLLYVFP